MAIVPALIIAGVALVFVITALFQWQWNITVPDVFGLRQIAYWQAFRLLILAGLFFGASSLVQFNFGS
jgi:ABC-type cobalamin transport system permease subunit